MKKHKLFFLLITCIFQFVMPEEDPIEIVEPTTFVLEGYSKVWEDHFDSTKINTNNWVVGF